MAVSRGYHNYRGRRRSKGKVLLAVLLILVILISIVIMLLQKKYAFYDETGALRLEVPWQGETSVEEPEDAVELDLIIQESVKPSLKEVKAFTVPVGQLTRNAYDSARAAAEPSCNAVAVTVKDSDGLVYLDLETAASGTVKTEADTAAVLAELTGEGSDLYTIARFSCFSDPVVANSDVKGSGLENTGGYIFYDGKNDQWLDPAKPAARQYLCGMAKEVAALGFDELLLTDVSYPTEGKLDKIAYGETPRNENLLTFLEELRAALEPYSVALSIEVPAGVITSGQDDAAGLVLSEIASKVDHIYAPALPGEVQTFSAAVAAVSDTAVFVPVLAAYDPAVTGSCLVF